MKKIIIMLCISFMLLGCSKSETNKNKGGEGNLLDEPIVETTLEKKLEKIVYKTPDDYQGDDKFQDYSETVYYVDSKNDKIHSMKLTLNLTKEINERLFENEEERDNFYNGILNSALHYREFIREKDYPGLKINIIKSDEKDKTLKIEYYIDFSALHKDEKRYEEIDRGVLDMFYSSLGVVQLMTEEDQWPFFDEEIVNESMSMFESVQRIK